MHQIEYRCHDALNNTAGTYSELDIVDTLEPVITKNVTEGIEGDGNPVHYFLDEESVVTLDCVDQYPHPVDDVTLYWEMVTSGRR